MSERLKYGAVNSLKYGGWCVFMRESELIANIFSGPFKSEAHAESEAKRLNEFNNDDEENSMENQHKKIKGYRDLSEEEILMMNNIKEQGEMLGVMIESLSRTESVDQRWVAIAKTDLQKGIMAAVRSVAQPTTF